MKPKLQMMARGAFKCQARVFRFGPREQWVFTFFQQQSTWQPRALHGSPRGTDFASLQDSVSVREQDCRAPSAVGDTPTGIRALEQSQSSDRQDPSLPNLLTSSYMLFLPSFCLLKACMLAASPSDITFQKT